MAVDSHDATARAAEIVGLVSEACAALGRRGAPLKTTLASWLCDNFPLKRSRQLRKVTHVADLAALHSYFAPLLSPPRPSLPSCPFLPSLPTRPPFPPPLAPLPPSLPCFPPSLPPTPCLPSVPSVPSSPSRPLPFPSTTPPLASFCLVQAMLALPPTPHAAYEVWIAQEEEEASQTTSHLPAEVISQAPLNRYFVLA